MVSQGTEDIFKTRLVFSEQFRRFSPSFAHAVFHYI